jgi:hypothetical protein
MNLFVIESRIFLQYDFVHGIFILDSRILPGHYAVGAAPRRTIMMNGGARCVWPWVLGLMLATMSRAVLPQDVQAREVCNFTDTSLHPTPLVLVDKQVAYRCEAMEDKGDPVRHELSCFTTQPSATTVQLRVEFLDTQGGQAAWKFWFRIDNPSSHARAAKITAIINNRSCTKGPYTLASGGFVASSCTIQPEPSITGLYTMVITTDRDPELQYNYLLCQKN